MFTCRFEDDFTLARRHAPPSLYIGIEMTNNSQPSAVRPGYHPGFNSYNFGELERKVLATLANEFYLTNPGNAVSLGKNAQYRYFLLKVPEDYTEEFNLKREVVCVFANYRSFEPRTLDAFDAAFANYQTLRLENVCRILISGDDSIQEHLDALLTRQSNRFRASFKRPAPCRILLRERQKMRSGLPFLA